MKPFKTNEWGWWQLTLITAFSASCWAIFCLSWSHKINVAHNPSQQLFCYINHNCNQYILNSCWSVPIYLRPPWKNDNLLYDVYPVSRWAFNIHRDSVIESIQTTSSAQYTINIKLDLRSCKLDILISFKRKQFFVRILWLNENANTIPLFVTSWFQNYFCQQIKFRTVVVTGNAKWGRNWHWSIFGKIFDTSHNILEDRYSKCLATPNHNYTIDCKTIYSFKKCRCTFWLL